MLMENDSGPLLMELMSDIVLLINAINKLIVLGMELVNFHSFLNLITYLVFDLNLL